MKSLVSQFAGLAERESFNASVRHIKTVVSIVDRIAEKENLGDIVDSLLESRTLDKADVLPVVSMVLAQKYRYVSVSANLLSVAENLEAISDETVKWNGVDLVVVYHHPDLGALVVNPKNRRRMAQIDRLNRAEFLVVYAGRFEKDGDPKLMTAACEAVIDLFSGRKPKLRTEFYKGDCAYKPPKEPKVEAAPAREAKVSAKAGAKKGKAGGAKPGRQTSSAKAESAAASEPTKAAVAAELAVKPGSRMTPMYSVLVTNELFHNGNVEAWKRIIASYKEKHPDLEVLVYYDKERITNLNALFKWGKVKHGSTIQFAIVGENISDVAKLQRYLTQGASHMFEAFLKGPVNSVMALF
jgi:hypothetical protein